MGPAGRGRYSTEEQALRVELAAIFKMLAKENLTELTFTHASVRLPGPDKHLLMGPYGELFEDVTASKIVKVDMDGNQLEQNGYEYSPSAFPMHTAIQSGREDAKAVIHLHTLAGSAVAAQSQGLLMLNQISMLFFGKLGYHDYQGITYDTGERASFLQDLGDNSAMILRNHGLVTVGNTPGQAWIRMYYLHLACQIQVAALAGSPNLLIPSNDICAHVQKQWEGSTDADKEVTENGSIDRAWDACLRKLDCTDPGYRD
jgi:ribulose-5-phosphate 4-epimerase/fuculose-1-phosphate aldolase